MIFPKKPQILYAPMLATMGGGSANGFGRNTGGGLNVEAVDVFGDGSGLAFWDFEINAAEKGGNYSTSTTSAVQGNHNPQLGGGSLRTQTSQGRLESNFTQSDTSAWSCSFWFRRTNSSSLSTNNRMVDFKEHRSSKGTTISYEGDGQFHFVLRCDEHGNGSRLVGSKNTLCDNQLHHIVVGCSSSAVPFAHVDNTRQSNSDSGYNRSDSEESGGIRFGHGYGGGMGNSDTIYDNIRFFNKELTEDECSALYAAEYALI